MNLRQAQRVIDQVPDDRLLAFVKWCRMNDTPFVDDPLVVRGVLTAYFTGPKVTAETNTEGTVTT